MTKDSRNRGLEEPQANVIDPLQELREDGRNAGCLTWTEGDDRAGLPLDLDSHPNVHLLFAWAGRSSRFGLWAATASIAGN